MDTDSVHQHIYGTESQRANLPDVNSALREFLQIPSNAIRMRQLMNVVRRPRARVVEMNANIPRIVESILVLIEEAQHRRVPITQYDIVKALFLADRGHLNKFGRPITYDNYVAMKHGPVPSFAYDLLKENAHAMRKLEDGLPWRRRAAPKIGNRCFVFTNPARKANEDVLSPSDIEALKAALVVVQTLGFQQIRKLTHEDRAYQDAWDDEGDREQYPMSYALLFDVPNDKKADEIAFASKHV